MQPKVLQGEYEKRYGIFYEYDPYSKPLGEGGMGIVYKGFRVNATTGSRQVVAIKAMKDGLPDEVYGRAKREAGIQLKNDNLVEMYGFISTTEQELGGRVIRRYYVISEFLNGVVLTDLLKGKFKDRDGIEIPYAKQLYTSYISDRKTTSVQIIKRVLAGIMALHDRGYIHRDIDPSNIMVTKEGNLKMIDFGIAKDTRNLNTQDGLRTATGKFIGKAEYAAPELVLGDVRSQNFTTDVYAIGILFYQLLVGKLPFDGPQYDVLQKQLHKNVPVRNVPFSEYRAIIKKATAKEQPSRYQSCIEMRAAIDSAKPSLDWRLIGRVAAGVVIVFGLGFGAFKIIPTMPNNDNKSQVQIGENNPKRETPVVDTQREEFDKALAMLNSPQSAESKEGWAEMMNLAKSGYPAAKREIGITYYTDHQITQLTPTLASRRKNLGLSNSRSYDESRELLKEPQKWLEDIKEDSVMNGEALVALGMAYWRNGNMGNAKECFRKAAPLLKNTNEELYQKIQEKLNN